MAYTTEDLNTLSGRLSPEQRSELFEASRDILKHHKSDLIRGQIQEAGLFAVAFSLVAGPLVGAPLGAAVGYVAHKIGETLTPDDYASKYPEFDQAVERITRRTAAPKPR